MVKIDRGFGRHIKLYQKKEKKKWGQSLCFPGRVTPHQMSPLRKVDADVTSYSTEMTQLSVLGQPPYSFQASTWKREGRGPQTLGCGSLPTAGAGAGARLLAGNLIPRSARWGA